MKLTLKDRVLILNTVLPQFDTLKNMKLKISIDRKIAIPEVDQKRIVIKDLGGGQINIGFTDATAITDTTDILLTDEELSYLKNRVEFIDMNGMFSEFTMTTYERILDEPLQESVEEVVEAENPTEESISENADQAAIDEDEETYAH
ncbi:hypothetical protein [Parabacteroides goldsteinii]|uniref:hypothetical protein n=1 Tax=Parabacteroides goldsteinii TaxID=328812 RepID=UPI0032B1B36B